MSTIIQTTIRQIGNSQGVMLNKTFLAMAGLKIGDELMAELRDDRTIKLSKKKAARDGWAEAAKALTRKAL